MAPASEFGGDIAGKQLRVRSRNVYIDIFDAVQIDKHVGKLAEQLHFVEKHVALAMCLFQAVDCIGVEDIGIPVLLVPECIERHFDDVPFRNALFK